MYMDRSLIDSGWGSKGASADKIAVECHTKDGFKELTSWFEVSQDESPCYTDPSTVTITDQALVYSHTPDTWTKITSDNIFTVKDNVNCPMKSC